MWIVGLTGAVGAGKTTLLKQFKKLSVPVHCSDRTVHSLLEKEDVQNGIRALFPDIFLPGKIKRTVLSDYVFKSPSRLRALETLLYPKLAESQKTFLLDNFNRKSPFVILDIPLLLEVGLQKYCHFIIVVETPYETRKRRVLNRRGMTIEKFEKLESNQISDSLRRSHADRVIQSGGRIKDLLEKAKEVLSLLSQKSSPPWKGEWPDTFKKEIYAKRNRSRY